MWNGVVTNLGLSLLEQWAAGSETLYIDKATAGSGTVAQSNMRGSTYVQGEVGDVSIVASIPVTGGTQYRIQVSANPDAAYIMHQIGIWAHLGASGGTTLLALYQDEDGVSVPLEADDPGFGFTLYAVVSMSNQGSVSVNFDGGAYVTRDDFSNALAGYAKTVNSISPDANGNVVLPVDATPTNGSSNPVSSDGVFDALAGKQATLTFDSAPTSGSANPVTSGGVYTGLASKAPVVTLADGTDLDTVTTSGLYYLNAGGVNLPGTAINGYILVISNSTGSAAKQLFMRRGTLNTNDFLTYVRQFNGTAWSNWIKILTAGEAVAISEGGTGATTANAALTNLGIGALFSGGTVYSTMSALITAIQARANNDKMIYAVSADIIKTLTNSTSTLPAIAVILKASASNAYYFAFNRDGAGYGNINYSSGTASIIEPLVGNLYKPGDTFANAEGITLQGLITSVQKTLNIGIYTPKSLRYVSSISVTSFLGGVRIPSGGYLGSGNASSPWASTDSFQWVGASGITIEAVKASDNMINIQFKSSTAYTSGNTTTAVPNNIPVSIYAKFSLSFS